MSNSDINFKTRKSPRYQNDRPGAVVAPGQKWRSAMAHNEDDDYDSKQKKRKMLRDDTELGMRNTLRIDNTSKSSIFPSIDGGKKDKQSPIGTALNRRSDDDLLDDTYYRHRVIVHKDDHKTPATRYSPRSQERKGRSEWHQRGNIAARQPQDYAFWGDSTHFS